jgi:hypothetical protein
MLEPATRPVEFRRVTSDVAQAASAIRAADLPKEFAADIETGGNSK